MLRTIKVFSQRKRYPLGLRRAGTEGTGFAGPNPEFTRSLISTCFGPHLLYCLRTMCIHNIPDHIHNGKTTSKELAEATKLHEPTLYRIVRTLSLLDIVTFKEEDRSFTLTANGQTLRSDHPMTITPAVKLFTAQFRPKVFAKWDEMVETGQSAMARAYDGKLFFDYMSENPEDRKIFNEAMSKSVAGMMHDLLAAHYPLEGVKVLVDVGGGLGKLGFRIVSRCPNLKAIAFDLPEVVADATLRHERLQYHGGNFFEAETFPKGFDAASLTTILHDWNDEECIQILKNIRKGISSGGKLFISEHLVAHNAPSPALLMDLEMMLMLSGRERTLAEFNRICSAAGFKFVKVTDSKTGASVLEYVAA